MIEINPLAQPAEVLRQGVGLPRHRAVGRIGEDEGVLDELDLGEVSASFHVLDLRSQDRGGEVVDGERALASVLRRDLLDRSTAQLGD